jgi:hypothetical protein
MHTDPRRYAREREHGEEPGHTPERERESKTDPERGEHATEQLDRAVWRDRRSEHARAECGEAEAGNALAARLRNEQQREAEARNRPTEMRETDQRTNTAPRLT